MFTDKNMFSKFGKVFSQIAGKFKVLTSNFVKCCFPVHTKIMNNCKGNLRMPSLISCPFKNNTSCPQSGPTRQSPKTYLKLTFYRLVWIGTLEHKRIDRCDTEWHRKVWFYNYFNLSTEIICYFRLGSVVIALVLRTIPWTLHFYAR